MNRLYKITLLIATLLVAVYWSSYYLMPSITIVNNSETTITRAEVDLPSSHLDFGSIPISGSNTLHYSLLQEQDGVYRYKLFKSNSKAYQGSCGYVTNNEINKRVEIVIQKDNQVTCN